MKKNLYLFPILVIAFFTVKNSEAQNNNVGIGTLTPNSSAMLDVVSTSKGALFPRVNTAQMNAIPAPANGLVVYNTDSACFCFYKSLTWKSLCSAGGVGPAGPTGPTGPTGPQGPAGPSWTLSTVTYNTNGTVTVNGTAGSGGPITSANAAWLTTGNVGTTAGTNFIGTTDAQDFVTNTGGASVTNERMRILQGGQPVINRTTIQAGDVFSVYGTGYTGAINPLGDFAVNGYVSGTGSGIYGENGGTGTALLGINTSSGPGAVGQSTSGYGVIGTATGTGVSGVRGSNAFATGGAGIIGLGNAVTPGSAITGGCGVAANGTLFGSFSLATGATGTGVVGTGNNVATSNTSTAGSGVAGTGTLLGVVGYATTALASNPFGGYFENTLSANGYAYVGGTFSGTDYAINSAGVKATMVKGFSNENRVMFCTEAPEVLFQDFGTAQLANGSAHIDIDPLLAKNIFTDAAHPLKVFVQLEGDCKGVYITNKTKNGFDVIELGGGKSNVAFSWQLVANRADTKDASGNVTSQFASIRFPVGPDRMKTNQNGLTRLNEQAPVKKGKK